MGGGSLWLYLGCLLLALVAINALLMRAIRAEKRQAEERSRRGSRR